MLNDKRTRMKVLDHLAKYRNIQTHIGRINECDRNKFERQKKKIPPDRN